MIKKKLADIIENLEAEINLDNETFRVLQQQEERNNYDIHTLMQEEQATLASSDVNQET